MSRDNRITIRIYCQDTIIHMHVPVFSLSCNNSIGRFDFRFTPVDHNTTIKRTFLSDSH